MSQATLPLSSPGNSSLAPEVVKRIVDLCRESELQEAAQQAAWSAFGRFGKRPDLISQFVIVWYGYAVEWQSDGKPLNDENRRSLLHNAARQVERLQAEKYAENKLTGEPLKRLPNSYFRSDDDPVQGNGYYVDIMDVLNAESHLRKLCDEADRRQCGTGGASPELWRSRGKSFEHQTKSSRFRVASWFDDLGEDFSVLASGSDPDFPSDGDVVEFASYGTRAVSRFASGSDVEAYRARRRFSA